MRKYRYVLHDGSNIAIGPFNTRGDAVAYRNSDKNRRASMEVLFLTRPPHGWKNPTTKDESE